MTRALLIAVAIAIVPAAQAYPPLKPFKPERARCYPRDARDCPVACGGHRGAFRCTPINCHYLPRCP